MGATVTLAAQQAAAGLYSGAIPFRLVSANTTNATSVKAGPGTVSLIHAYNSGGAACYLKFYDKASAPTVGTDTPVLVIALPAGGAGAPPVLRPLAFANGIALAITVNLADSDTTAVAANQAIVSLGYN